MVRYSLAGERLRTNRVLAYGLALAIGMIAIAITLPPWALRGLLPPGAPYGPDPASQIVAQRYFFAENWHWNLLHIDGLMEPWGINLAFADSIPVAALTAKLLRPVLPYFDQVGTLWLALCWLCQPAAAVFALRSAGERRLVPGICIAAMASSLPAFLARLNHPSLSAHFMLLLLLGCYLRGVARSRGAIWAGCGIAAALLLVHPYLLFMGLALPTATCVTLLWRRDLLWREAALSLVVSLFGALLLSWALGLMNGGDAGVYGFHSMNLAAPFYPARSGLFPGFPLAAVDATGGQSEGYAYLGAGLLTVVAIALLRPRLISDATGRHPGLLLACLVLLILAVSNRVYFFHTLLFHVHTATGSLDKFRASGRFVWVPTYALLVGGVVLALRGQPRFARFALPAAAMLSLYDGSAIWAHDRAWLTDPAPWYFNRDRMEALLKSHATLTILPPAGCVPGSNMGVMQPLWLAADTHMPTSTMYIGRKVHTQSCDVASALTGQPRPGELILVQPGFLSTVTASPMLPRCRQIGAYAACTVDDAALIGLPPIGTEAKLPVATPW